MTRFGILTGVDMVDVRRLARMVNQGGQAFLDNTWTEAELAFCGSRIDRLAARWAAKEAVMKALGSGVGTVDPLQIEVVRFSGKPPRLRLCGNAETLASKLRVISWSLSLAHESQFAVATATSRCRRALRSLQRDAASSTD